MPLHIGKIIQQKVKAKRVRITELVKALNTSRGNIYDIYTRETIDSGLLLNICRILDVDLFEFYYQEEPLKSFRARELQKTQKELQVLKNALAQKEERIRSLEELNASQKKVISLLEKKK